MNQINLNVKKILNNPFNYAGLLYFKKTWIFIIGISLFSSINTKATASPFAELVSLTHACGNNGGSAEFEILGTPISHYTWYWLHGPTERRLEDLNPGTYTFVVKDFLGCVEEYEIEILAKDQCEMTYEIVPIPHNRCSVEIVITIFNEGIPVPEGELDIVWEDGDPSGLIRQVPIGCETTNLFCVDISLIETEEICCSNEENCCSFHECFEIEALRGCCSDRIIVNEFNRAFNGGDQFLELLVIGDGECGGFFDLRGMHIDDNNGTLISGNDFVDFNNKDQIGINNGFISFQHDTVWSAVPNGSLILIYPEGQHSNLPADDPTDENQDGVYVLSGSNSQYLIGNKGTWNNAETLLEYEGSITYPSWNQIDISPTTDGMQVVFPDGSLSHGISLGESFYSVENTFPLWITANSSSDCNCRFTGTDYNLATHFLCQQSGSTSSPGLANSIDNEALILSLRDCNEFDSGSDREENQSEKVFSDESNALKVYPNPFDSKITLNFNTYESGGTKVILYSIAGQTLLMKEWHSEKGSQTYQLEIGQRLPPGVILLQFTFPSGEKKNQYLVRMDSY